jgi:hypothetical protein
MWRDEKPGAPQWVVSSMRDIVEDLFRHLGGEKENAEVGELN